MPRSAFVLNEPAYRRFIGWEGPIGRDLQRRARYVEFQARQTAPVYRPIPGNPLPNQRIGGSLKASIRRVRDTTVTGGLAYLVGANPIKGGPKGYAYWQHEGAGPHVIAARNVKFLRFYWQRIGEVVITKRVNHPGNPALKYLSRWLPRAVR